MKRGDTSSDVICEICNSTINIAADGKSGIEKDLGRDKHQQALNAKAKTHVVTTFFASSADYIIAAREGVWSYHVIKANLSFKSSDCASKIFRTCFDMRTFHCARTKCEAFVMNVFAPFVLDGIKKELPGVHYNHLNRCIEPWQHQNAASFSTIFHS